MRILVSLKPEHYELYHHAYGVLAEIDWEERRVVRTLVLPAASFRNREAFMAPLCGGMAAIGDRVFVSVWNYVVEVDYPTFRIVNVVSTPWMADIHGLTTDGRTLWLASTAVTAVLGLDAATLAPVWRWGPDEPILHWRAQDPFWRAALRRMGDPSSWWRGRSFTGEEDFRHVHKSRSPHYRHHLNEVTWHQGRLYVDCKGWWEDEEGGAVIVVDPTDGRAEFFIPPGGVLGPHDGIFREGRFYVTESAAHGVAWRESSGQVVRQRLSPDGNAYFVRGMCDTGHSFLVGFSRLRRTEHHSLVVEYDQSFQQELGRMEMVGFYPTVPGAAVHQVILAPRGKAATKIDAGAWGGSSPPVG